MIRKKAWLSVFYRNYSGAKTTCSLEDMRHAKKSKTNAPNPDKPEKLSRAEPQSTQRESTAFKF
jgi:hypothetical protein